jgi:YlmC/YmxH family sporulation protein
MRLSDFSGKEVINLGDGARLGVIDDCELTFDSKSGKIENLVLPNRHSLFSFFTDKKGAVITWRAVKRIGDEVVIVDLNNAFDRMYASLHGDNS